MYEKVHFDVTSDITPTLVFSTIKFAHAKHLHTVDFTLLQMWVPMAVLVLVLFSRVQAQIPVWMFEVK